MDILTAQALILVFAVFMTLIVLGQFFVMVGNAFHKRGYTVSMILLLVCSALWTFFFVAVRAEDNEHHKELIQAIENSNSVVLPDTQPDTPPAPLNK